MKRILSSETPSKIGESIEAAGWVSSRRDHGKLIFLDLRDKGGLLQVVVTPKNKEAYEAVQDVRSEWVVKIQGTIQERPTEMRNRDLATGAVELSAESLTVLSPAKTPPIPLDGDGYGIGEEARLRYRYLDLRRERMKRNLETRSRVVRFMREFLYQEGFCEIETPLLTKSTPEGARDFLVPSRLEPGKFYALPQSPQQYKQLLQVAGFEKYFQIARALRDEDPRADRQAEHTQLDLEMSFVEREDVMALLETLYTKLVSELFPGKKISQVPFPILTYKEAIEKHGTDRPDLRADKE
ncbi:MAG: aspartate--tRNA ligase, partial [Candidatus Pacearchaeota archaeon]|nr:aspartate--tRNA ligase [Candidatus Pacearchaeota archaeon]